MPPAHGCMTCKGQHPYTVEQYPNGNTGWRCQDCGQILCLVPGKYLLAETPASVDAQASLIEQQGA